MSTFGGTPQSGPGASETRQVDPRTYPGTEPEADATQAEPSLDASELDEQDGDEQQDGEGTSSQS
ncbi:MAG: hypothetical protein PGN15_00125 [Aeromicrobium erythreum]